MIRFKYYEIVVSSRWVGFNNPLAYTPLWGIKMYVLFFLKKKIPTLLKYRKGQTHWDHAQIPCQDVTIKMFNSSLSKNMHRHIIIFGFAP
jgi:hypothetical protein